MALDLVELFAFPVPFRVICELLGAPKEDWKLFSGWATDIFRIFNNDVANDLAAIETAMDELDDYARLRAGKYATRPAELDLVALLEQSKAWGGKPISVGHVHRL